MSEIDFRDSSQSELIGELYNGINHRISRLESRIAGSAKKTPDRDLQFTPTKVSSPDSDVNRSPNAVTSGAKLLGPRQLSKQV